MRFTLLCSALLLTACGVGTVTASVRVNPNMVVSAFVDLTPPAHTTAISVDYGDAPTFQTSTPRIPVTAGVAVSIPAVGITANATSQFRANAWSGNTLIATSKVLTLQTGPLPDDFPRFTVTNSGVTDGCILVSIAESYDTPGLGLIIDRAGKVVWYRPIKGISPLGYDFQRQPNGHFTLYQGNIGAFEELDMGANVVHTWTAPGATLGTDGHDMAILPNGNALLTGRALHYEDTRPYYTNGGGSPDGGVEDAVVEEVDPSGTAVFHWSSNPEVTLAENNDLSLATDPRSGNVDAVHVDSVAPTADGNILISGYYTGDLMKINRATDSIEWRFGGAMTNFPTLLSDPLNGMDHPHMARDLGNGDALMIDEGWTHTPQQSRAVQYNLNTATHTASMDWSWEHPNDLPGWEPEITAGGSAVRMANGNTLTSWSLNQTITEVDMSGAIQWEAQEQPWVLMYRAIPVDTLYPPL